MKRDEVACQDGQLKRDIVLRWDGGVKGLGGRLRNEEVRNDIKGRSDTSTGRNCVKRRWAMGLVFD